MSTAVAVIVLSALGIALAVISFAVGWATRGMRVDALDAEGRRILREIPSIRAMREPTTQERCQHAGRHALEGKR